MIESRVTFSPYIFLIGGKPCLHTDCRKRIFHEKWKASRDPKLAEDRWAHQEAKRRELDEVVDFLGL